MQLVGCHSRCAIIVMMVEIGVEDFRSLCFESIAMSHETNLGRK